MEFYAYRECNDAQGNMKAFTIILADKNQANRKPLQQIGTVEESAACEGYTFPSPFIYRAAIFTQPDKDGSKITGIRFQSVVGVTDLGGPPDVKAEIVNFDERNQLIGFYGTYSQQYITSLGFLQHDPTCQAYTSDPNDPANNGGLSANGGTESKDDDKTNVGIIVGPIVAAVLLIGGGLGAFFFLRWRKMKKMRQMGADFGQSSTTKVKVMAADPPDFSSI